MLGSNKVLLKTLWRRLQNGSIICNMNELGQTKRYTTHELIQNFLQRAALPPRKSSAIVLFCWLPTAIGFPRCKRHPCRRWWQSHKLAARSHLCSVCCCSNALNTLATTAAAAVTQSRWNTSSCSRCSLRCSRHRHCCSCSSKGCCRQAWGYYLFYLLLRRCRLHAWQSFCHHCHRRCCRASGAALGCYAGSDDVAHATAEEMLPCALRRPRLRAAAAATACARTTPPLLELLHGPSRLALLTAPLPLALESALCSL